MLALRDLGAVRFDGNLRWAIFRHRFPVSLVLLWIASVTATGICTRARQSLTHAVGLNRAMQLADYGPGTWVLGLAPTGIRMAGTTRLVRTVARSDLSTYAAAGREER